jgi:dihydroorotate dehydrogenase electron transfer subunit
LERLGVLPIDSNLTRLVTIDEVVMESVNVKTLIFRDKLSSLAKAGQFIMVWIPRIEEIPMSVMVSLRSDHAAVSVKKYGVGSTALFERKKGDLLGVRGPYGNKFRIFKKFKHVLLIGGGTGLVPLLRLAVKINNLGIRCTMIIGARTKNEVIFEGYANNFLRDTVHRVLVTTDDGSYGTKGTTVDAMLHEIENESIDCIYTCGPERMMKKVFDFSSTRYIPMQASIERYMKCGIGICGSCCIDNMLVCRDGTVFGDRELRDMNEFGSTIRDKDGQKIYI